MLRTCAELPLYDASPPVAAALRSMATAVNNAVSLAEQAAATSSPAAVTCVAHCALVRKDSAERASGPEVGSSRLYRFSCTTWVPMKLSTRFSHTPAEM